MKVSKSKTSPSEFQLENIRAELKEDEGNMEVKRV